MRSDGSTRDKLLSRLQQNQPTGTRDWDRASLYEDEIAVQPPSNVRQLLSNLNLLATAPDGVARLRELILTLAVQGKLVPQDPSDEPASVLLTKIRAEKNRLIAEGKIKRDKPLAEIGEDEKPYALAVGWVWQTLAEVGDWAIGSGFPIEAQGRDGLPILFAKVSDMNLPGNELNIVRTNHTIDEETVSKLRVNVHSAGTVIFPKIGGAIATNKRRILVHPTAIDNNCLGIAPSGAMSTCYLFLLLSSIDFTIYQAGTSVPALSQGTLGQIPVALPPLAEQSRIVTRVEELMRLCDALQAKARLESTQHAQLVAILLSTLTASTTPKELTDNWHRVATHFDLLLDRPEAVDALEQTILQLAVRGLLVPQDPKEESASILLQKIRVEKDRLIAQGKIKRDKALPPIAEEERPFELPDGWAWVRLRELVTHLGDGLHGTPHYSPTGEYYFVNGNNLRDGAIVIKPETKRVDKPEFEKYKKPLDATTVLLSINGTLGNVAFYSGEQVVLGKSACYFNLTSGLAKPFVRTLLECQDFQGYATTNATGSTIKNLGLKVIGDWPIALPPLAEQFRIVARVASLRVLCADLRQRLTTARTQQALLAQVFVQDIHH